MICYIIIIISIIIIIIVIDLPHVRAFTWAWTHPVQSNVRGSKGRGVVVNTFRKSDSVHHHHHHYHPEGVVYRSLFVCLYQF